VHLGFEQAHLSVYPWIQAWLARTNPTRAVQRFVNCTDDIVTRVPPESLLGYQHLPQEIYIDRHGEIQPAISDSEKSQDASAARRHYIATET
jgi:DNA-binding FadR family transcriptional regulator